MRLFSFKNQLIVAYESDFGYNNHTHKDSGRIDMTKPTLLLSSKDDRRKVIETLIINDWTASNRSPNILTRDFKSINADGVEQLRTYRINFKERVVRIELKSIFKNTSLFDGNTKNETLWTLIQSVPMKSFNIYESNKDGRMFLPFLNKKYIIEKTA